MLSPLAASYLQMWERRGYIDDLAVVSQLLVKLGVPVTRPLIDFHETFAGYVGKNWLNDVEFGLVLTEGGCQPNIIHRNKTTLIQCAEVDPQDLPPYVDLQGRYYRCAEDNTPIASSFFFRTEQCAYAFDWVQRMGAESIPLPWDKSALFQQMLRTMTAGCEISGFGDEFSDLYLKDNLLVFDDSYSTSAWIAPGPYPSELIEVIGKL